MKSLRLVVLSAALVGAVALFAAGCKKPEEPAPSAAREEIAQKICPVMGEPINPNIHADYEGRRIYFCCTSCLKAFEKDPEKYIAKVDEKLKGAAEPAKGEMPMPASGEHAHE
ncbi:MAG: YHS domain-containing protein [Phycisphaerae bacterium]